MVSTPAGPTVNGARAGRLGPGCCSRVHVNFIRVQENILLTNPSLCPSNHGLRKKGIQGTVAALDHTHCQEGLGKVIPLYVFKALECFLVATLRGACSKVEHSSGCSHESVLHTTAGALKSEAAVSLQRPRQPPILRRAEQLGR